jgi:hypothetical protein
LAESRAYARHPREAICDGRFHYLQVPGTHCMDATPTGFEYACLTGSPASPLLIVLDGGGACFDGDTCNCMPDANGVCMNLDAGIFRIHFGEAQSDDGRDWADTRFGQTAFFAGPTSSFNRNWNVVHIPYCTGDAHGGHAVRDYIASDGTHINAHHDGYENVTRDLGVIQSLFPRPSRVAVYGASSGGLGVDCNIGQIRATFPQGKMYAFNNSGLPFEFAFTPGVSDAARTWGIWHPGEGGLVVADTCPIQAPPGATVWDVSDVESFNRLHLPDVRKALTDDYSDDVMQFFACLLGAATDPSGTTCAGAVANILNDVADRVITATEPNYRVYYHTGTCHSMREQDGNPDPTCDFDQMEQDGVAFSGWVAQWINDSPSWSNVR